jgi:hypothetical protein
MTLRGRDGNAEFRRGPVRADRALSKESLMRLLAVAVVAWALAGTAGAQDWVYGAHGGGIAQGFDADSVTRNGALRTARVVVVASGIQTLPTGRTWDYVLTHEEFDCTNLRRRVLSSTAHRFSDSEAFRTHEEPGDWSEPTAAGSVSGVVIRAICSDTRLESMGFTTGDEFARAARRVFEGGAA